MGFSRLQRMERDAWRMNTHDAEGGVPYSCAGHRVPYFAAVKDPNPVNDLLYVLGIFLILGKQITIY